MRKTSMKSLLNLRESPDSAEPADLFSEGARTAVNFCPENILAWFPDHDTCRDGVKQHQRFCLFIILSGEVDILRDGQPIHLNAGTGHLAFPFQVHSESPSSAKTMVITFTEQKDSSGDITPLRNCILTFYPFDVQLLQQIFWGTRGKNGFNHNDAASALKWLIARQMMQAVGPNSFITNHAWEALFHEITSYIVRNMEKRITIDELVLRFHVSRTNLFRMFQKYLGYSRSSIKTPGRMIQTMKIQQASDWLHTTSWSVKEIAEKTGYPDQFSFSRRFKSIYGISPSEARREYLELKKSESEPEQAEKTSPR